MATLLQDLRYGTRMLAKNPSFTAVAALTLALGIGANTGVFSVLNAILLRPLPLPDSSRVMIVETQNAAKGGNSFGASKLDFAIWRDQSHVFEHLGASSFRPANLTGRGEPHRVPALEVSADYFAVLGVPAALGRTFLPADDGHDHETLVVLSHELWEQSFGSDRGLIGKPMALDGNPATVIGIMPVDFELPFFPSQVWVLAKAESRALSPAMGVKRPLMVLARLKPGVTVEAAQAELTTISRHIEQDYPDSHRGWGVSVTPLEKFLIRIAKVEGRLAVMTGALIFVLLIACANVAGLLVARGGSRCQEMAIRAALGAGRLRLIRHLLIESLLLALLGGGLGVLVCAWWLDTFRLTLNVTDVPRFWITGLEINRRVLGFTLALSALTALLFGLIPALHASKPDLHAGLKEGGRSGSEGRARSRLRRALVAGEIALTLVLMTGAGLLIRNFLESANPGLTFDPDRVLTADVSLAGSAYDEPDKQAAFFQQALERLRTLPEVPFVAVTSNLPLNYTWGTSFAIREQSSLPASEGLEANYFIISPSYLGTFGIPLLGGRAFTGSDASDAPAVALVNEELVHRFFPNENPLGHHIRVEADGTSTPSWREIVGVVGNVKDWPAQQTDNPQIYVPYLQRPSRSLYVVLRGDAQPRAFVPALRSAVWAVDKNQSVEDVKTMTQVIARRVGATRIQSLWMSFFACVALVMAAVGIYGVVAYSVSRRIQEIGIRMALGARRHQVLTMMLREGAGVTGVGLLVGFVAAFPLPWILGSAIPRFAVHASLILIGAPVLVAMVALLAVYIPARRAAKVDPMVALRYE